MSSAAKALELLSHFSSVRPEIGLSPLCRLAKRDKATTYRHLQALSEAGMVEQNPTTKHYRLGPAVLHLAQVREATVPRKDGAQPVVQDLAEITGETAHVSVLSGSTLYTLLACASPKHGTRAVIDTTTLPLHATASGICALAFGPESLFDLTAQDLTAYTPHTPITIKDLSATVKAAHDTGFGQGAQSFEAEIQGLSAPVFDQTGRLAGTVSVACVAARFTPELEALIKASLITASRQITHNWGGTIPDVVQTAWAASLSHPKVLEATP